MRAKKFAVVLSCLFIFSSSFLFRRQARLLSLSVLWLLDWQQGMMDRSGMSRICILSQNPSAAKNRRDPFGQQFLYFRFRITWQSYCGNWDGISRLYIFPEHQKYRIFCVSFVISFRRCVNMGESAILYFGKSEKPEWKNFGIFETRIGPKLSTNCTPVVNKSVSPTHNLT